MRSLRARLVLMTGLVLVIAAVAVGMMFSRVTTLQFEQFLAHSDGNRSESAAREVGAYGAAHGGWQGVDSLLARIGARSDRLAVLLEANGTLHAPRQGPLAKARLRVNADGVLEVRRLVERGAGQSETMVFLRGTPLAAAGAPHATLYMAPGRPELALPQARSQFLLGVNRGLIVALVIAGALAALAALALGRRLLGPIEALTAAARRMERGDRAARVTVAARDEIGELAHAFNAMADSVARTERLRRDLVHDVSHELRTPLTNLRCQIEALQDGLAQPDAAALASLHEETLLLGRLVEDLQQLALAEAGQLRLEPAALDVRQVVARTVSALEAQAAQAGVAVANVVPGGVPAVRADAERVGQILRNLTDNALRHTPRGGRIEIGARRVGAAVEIMVRDDGPGIASEHLPNLFERFYRTDASRSRATGGAGLGLAIVRQLVLAQGGEVRVESEPGRGAAFFFTLPVAASS